MWRISILVLLAGLLLGGVAGAKINVASDPKADFSAFRTYAWLKPSDPKSQLDLTVRAVVDEVLRDKGLRKVELGDDPDLWIEYVVGSVDMLYAGFRATAGWWGGLWLVPGGRSSVEAGMILVLSDASNDEPVYGGITVMRGNAPNALQVMGDRVGKDTRKILKKYPAVGK